MTWPAVWANAVSCWAAVWTTVVSWRWGDIAAWAAVFVNALIVYVALSPIRIAKRERVARGRLVAAYLAFPMSLARATLKRGRKDMATLLSPNASSADHDAALRRFSEIPESVRGGLDRFNVSDATYLENGMGEKLAQSFGAVNAAVMAVPLVIKVATHLRALRNTGTPLDSSAIEQAQTTAAQLDEVFDRAITRLSVFTDYCRKLGFLGPGLKGRG